MYDKSWECIHVNKTMGLPYDAVQFKDEIFVRMKAPTLFRYLLVVTFESSEALILMGEYLLSRYRQQ